MKSASIYSLVRAVREQYDSHFDQTWFRIILDECPLERGVLREIRNFLDSERDELVRDETFLHGVANLEQFIRVVENYVSPNIKELLGVSGLRPEYRLRDHDQYVQRRLLAEVHPYNVRIIKSLVGDLKEAAQTVTPPVMADLPVYRSA